MIGKRIQQFRLEKGWSITELADRAGVAKSYLSSIERDLNVNPSIQFLEKIAAVLEVDIQSLLRTDDSSDHQPILDGEWTQLMEEAIQTGISKEQFKELIQFLSSYKKFQKGNGKEWQG